VKTHAPNEQQPLEGTNLLRLPQEDTCMALHRYLAKTGSILTQTPLDSGVLLLKRPEIIRAQDMDPVFIEF